MLVDLLEDKIWFPSVGRLSGSSSHSSRWWREGGRVACECEDILCNHWGEKHHFSEPMHVLVREGERVGVELYNKKL